MVDMPSNEIPRLSFVEKSLLLAAYYRGGCQTDAFWTSNSDQILTLSLFFTGDITSSDCVVRFSKCSYVQGLYDDDGVLTDEIKERYRILIDLLQKHPQLIELGGDFDTPADPTYTACRLTDEGRRVAESLKGNFPRQPHFPNWPDGG